MDPVILVFLGSMTMSACLSKLKITDRVSSFFFKRLSRKPSIILLTLMLLNWMIAAFLGNVASTVLVLSFSMPIIRSLDPSDPFCKSILFGIAWSGNCGGMATTIASPQNILAVSYIQSSGEAMISFLDWVKFAVPSSGLLLIVEWVYLLYMFKPFLNEIIVEEEIPKDPKNIDKNLTEWTIRHTYATIITILTITFWTLSGTFPNILGSVGITSLIPVIAFFGTEMLTVADFHSIRWSTLSLMGGGLALGEAMKISGLLEAISNVTNSVLKGIPMWPLLITFFLFMTIFASLINSTSAAAILYPLIGIMGKGTGHPNLFVALSALMISGAQLFHISSFPCAIVSGVCKHDIDDKNKITAITFLEGSDYPRYGWPTQIMAIGIFSSLGFVITYYILKI